MNQAKRRISFACKRRHSSKTEKLVSSSDVGLNQTHPGASDVGNFQGVIIRQRFSWQALFSAWVHPIKVP